MKFLKYLFVAILCTLYFVLSTKSARADSAFAVDANVTYNVDGSGQTFVTHDITLTNLYSTLYATTYTLSLENINASSVTAHDDSGHTIPLDIQSNGSNQDIKLSFQNAVVGKDSVRHFSVSYKNGTFAVKTGEVWEISIPRISDQASFRNYQVNLVVPTSLGQEAYISPQPFSSTQSDSVNTYIFSKDQVSSAGVTAGFGQFQVFSFNLSYHLENPLPVNSQTEIAIPPDTAYQKVYYTKIEPKPSDVRIDEDGNWLAVYNLSPRERLDINTVGAVQIFASNRQFPKPSETVLNNNLAPTPYWQSNNSKITELAKNLKTPSAIYDYVVKSLKYDFTRVQPNSKRLGAVAALDSPTQAICTEFTDLFIAIARAAGIPTREINGYAYTENAQLQPISLVADVLHAWPEYYDQEKGAWIPVDPTWGSTSGVDYFNKLDLRHFAFVAHGGNQIDRSAYCKNVSESDSVLCPYPAGNYKYGPNPQKDVYVSFGNLPANRNSTPQVSISVMRNIPFLSTIYSVNVYNPGPSSIDVFYPTVYFDDKEHSRDFVQILPPYASYTTQITVPFSLLGKDTPDIIKVIANGSQAQISTNKSQIVINSLLTIFAVFVILMMLILLKLKRLKFNWITATIVKIYANSSKKRA